MKNDNADISWHFFITKEIFVSMSVLAKFHDMMNMSTDFCNLFRKLYLENILYDIDISYLAVDSRLTIWWGFALGCQLCQSGSQSSWMKKKCEAGGD